MLQVDVPFPLAMIGTFHLPLASSVASRGGLHWVAILTVSFEVEKRSCRGRALLELAKGQTLSMPTCEEEAVSANKMFRHLGGLRWVGWRGATCSRFPLGKGTGKNNSSRCWTNFNYILAPLHFDLAYWKGYFCLFEVQRLPRQGCQA